MAIEFDTLEKIFTMLSPTDLSNIGNPSLGGRNEQITGFLKEIADMLENDGNGVTSVVDLGNKFKELQKVESNNIKKYFSIYADPGNNQSCIKVGKEEHFKDLDAKNESKNIENIKQLINVNSEFKKPILVMTSTSPFFHPARRHTKKVDIFLNSMPSTVLSQMVPYLDIEFQFTRPPSDAVQSMGQLKFLLGSPKKDSLSTSDAAMLNARQKTTKIGDTAYELNYAGMEMFTSPQTLVNPQPNLASRGDKNRYTDVLDPFRPFMSVDNVVVGMQPQVGTITYKKATLQLKLHDRSRLSEISELIRPQLYSNVVLWLTYGWRAPTRSNDPYMEFINNNFLVREAFGIVNSNFSFDTVGQVSLTLELFTKGIAEIKNQTISYSDDSHKQKFKELQDIVTRIKQNRRLLNLEPHEGVSKEVRYLQVLDSASNGVWPTDIKDLPAIINKLKNVINENEFINKTAAKQLSTDLETLFKGGQKDKKGSIFEKIDTAVSGIVNKKFLEVLQGPDPYLPRPSKIEKDSANQLLATELEQVKSGKHLVPNDPILTKKYNKRIVSFGKIFLTFVLDSIKSSDVTNEVQVFFYGFNDHAGPMRGRSIAEFPIDIVEFRNVYNDHVKSKATEDTKLEEFIRLLINSQLHDSKGLGYGLRSGYDLKQKVLVPIDKGIESASESRYKATGDFHQPQVEILVETSFAKTANKIGESDILAKINYSAKDFDMIESSKSQSTTIMRIHIFDKQFLPYPSEALLLKGDDDGTFRTITTDKQDEITKKSINAQKEFFNKYSESKKNKSQEPGRPDSKFEVEVGVGQKFKFNSASEAKALISKSVPSIIYGSNGSTIIGSNLSTKNDPLMTTVGILAHANSKNTTAPNGSNTDGLPMRVIPAALTMTTLGCPLAAMAQQYFIDFNTGTTIDNLYIVTNISHTISQGKFETAWTFGFSDAYGRFESPLTIAEFISKTDAASLKKAESESKKPTANKKPAVKK